MIILTRQQLFKDAQFFFRSGRGQLSNTCIIQHSRGEIICKQSMSSKAKIETQTQTVDASLEQKDVGSDLSVLAPTQTQTVDASLEQKDVGSDLSVLAPIGVDDGKFIIKQRLGTKRRVEEAICKKFGPRFTVEFFGSVHYGVSHLKSDLDMVVIDPRLSKGYTRLNGLGSIYSPKILGRTLSKAGFTHVDVRAGAAVPIVMFRDPKTGLDCDLNVNDRLGLINSSMIKEYCDAHPFVRPLLHRIKKWAKPLGLNTPSPGIRRSATFSSYALALMSISFLQKEGHLPNLQGDLPPITEKPNKNLMWTRKPHKGWDVRYKSAKDWVPPPLPDFETLVSSWYSYWIDFPYETECISIRDGGTAPLILPPPPTPKKNKKPKIITPSPMCVSDPFILTKNVTVSIASQVHESFVKECQNMVTVGK